MVGLSPLGAALSRAYWPSLGQPASSSLCECLLSPSPVAPHHGSISYHHLIIQHVPLVVTWAREVFKRQSFPGATLLDSCWVFSPPSWFVLCDYRPCSHPVDAPACGLHIFTVQHLSLITIWVRVLSGVFLREPSHFPGLSPSFCGCHPFPRLIIIVIIFIV